MKFVSPSLPFLVMLASFSGSASAQVTAPGLRRRLDSNSSAVAKDGNAPVVPATADNTTSPFKVPTKAPPKSSTLHSEAERTHRVWVQYKTDVTRSVCLESLQSKIMASTGAPAAEAKALLQAQGETVTTKSSSSSSANGQSRFRMHYDFFDTKLGSMVMTVDDAMLRSLQDDPTVKRIGKDVKRFPMVLKEDAGELANKDKHGSRNLQDELLPYGVSMVQADQVWNQGFKGQGVTVCVIDSGLDGTESLSLAVRQRLRICTMRLTTLFAVFHPEFRTDWVGFSTEAGDWFSDKSSHGTHTSGTIAARWNGQGVVGVAPEATVLTFKVFNALGEFAYASGVANAALSCQSAGANVVSMSLGGPEFSQEESDTFKLLFEQGVVSVAGTIRLVLQSV